MYPYTWKEISYLLYREISFTFQKLGKPLRDRDLKLKESIFQIKSGFKELNSFGRNTTVCTRRMGIDANLAWIYPLAMRRKRHHMREEGQA